MKKILKYLIILILNSVIVGTILGFIWYKLGFAKTTINLMSGVDTLQIVFLKYKYLYLIILSVIEFLNIILIKKLFDSKKIKVIYYITSVIVSMILLLISTVGFDTGYGIFTNNKEIEIQYIFIACLGLRYNFWLLILNIPTLIGLTCLSITKKNSK